MSKRITLVIGDETRELSEETSAKVLKLLENPVPYNQHREYLEMPFKDFPPKEEWFWRCSLQQRHDVVSTIITKSSTGEEFTYVDQQAEFPQ